MPRLRGRIDNTQNSIVEALRAAGCSVLVMSALGKGAPDICVYSPYLDRVLLLELKDSARRRDLTADEVRFAARWKGAIPVVRSAAEALEIVGLPVAV